MASIRIAVLNSFDLSLNSRVVVHYLVGPCPSKRRCYNSKRTICEVPFFNSLFANFRVGIKFHLNQIKAT